MTLDQLRKKYPEFIYKSFEYEFLKEGLKITFNFQISEIEFTPTVLIKEAQNNIDRNVLDNFVFHLGLIEMISYYKSTCSPKIIIKAGKLNKEQIEWFKNLIIKGLGEFFYINKIDFTEKDFLKIESENNKVFDVYSQDLEDKVLIPFSGGKDSFTTYRLLRESNYSCFTLNPSNGVRNFFEENNIKYLEVKRTIDEKLIEMNNSGYLNGHTPFSAYLAFLSSLCALLFDYKYIAFSNESSANEGNVKYLKEIINHQYSKSFEFEKDFREYLNKYMASEMEYFSFLRPIYEIQIAKIFSKFPEYFDDFLSCNEAYRTDSGKKEITGKWCGECSKCLFVFTILYPFIEEKELIKIFRKNIFEDEKMIPLMESLVLEEKEKPFDCVGTKKEIILALCLSIKKNTYNLPVVLNYFKDKCNMLNMDILNYWNEDNFVPKKFQEILKEFLK